MTQQEALKQYKEEIINRLHNGDSISKISRDLCYNSGAVWTFVQAMGIEHAKRSSLYGCCKKNKELIIERFNSGESMSSIARLLKIKVSSLQKKLKSWNIDTSTHRTWNPNNLLKDKTDLVIELHNQGKSQTEISKITGHTPTSIHKLLYKNQLKPRVWKYNVNESFFECIDTEYKAYILGWWYSDGNVMKNGTCRLQIADKDKYILDWIREQLSYSGPLHFVKRRRAHHHDQWCLSIGRNKIAQDLIKLGCVPNKSMKLEFPTIEQIPSSLIHHFVRGYFDGDGSSSNGIMIVGTLKFCKSLRDILPCRVTNIYQRYKDRLPENSSHQLFIGTKTEIKNFADWLYNNATIFLERKRPTLDSRSI